MEYVTGFWNLLLFILLSPHNDVAVGLLLVVMVVVGFALYGALIAARKLARAISRFFRKRIVSP